MSYQGLFTGDNVDSSLFILFKSIEKYIIEKNLQGQNIDVPPESLDGDTNTERQKMITNMFRMFSGELGGINSTQSVIKSVGSGNVAGVSKLAAAADHQHKLEHYTSYTDFFKNNGGLKTITDHITSSTTNLNVLNNSYMPMTNIKIQYTGQDVYLNRVMLNTGSTVCTTNFLALDTQAMLAHICIKGFAEDLSQRHVTDISSILYNIIINSDKDTVLATYGCTTGNRKFSSMKSQFINLPIGSVFGIEVSYHDRGDSHFAQMYAMKLTASSIRMLTNYNNAYYFTGDSVVSDGDESIPSETGIGGSQENHCIRLYGISTFFNRNSIRPIAYSDIYNYVSWVGDKRIFALVDHSHELSPRINAIFAFVEAFISHVWTFTAGTNNPVFNDNWWTSAKMHVKLKDIARAWKNILVPPGGPGGSTTEPEIPHNPGDDSPAS